MYFYDAEHNVSDEMPNCLDRMNHILDTVKSKLGNSNNLNNRIGTEISLDSNDMPVEYDCDSTKSVLVITNLDSITKRDSVWYYLFDRSGESEVIYSMMYSITDGGSKCLEAYKTVANNMNLYTKSEVTDLGLDSKLIDIMSSVAAYLDDYKITAVD